MNVMYNKREQAGKMRHRVQFWQPTYTVNDYGEKAKSYTALDPVWAHVEHIGAGSNEDEEAQRITSRVAAKITIRFNSSINAEWRLVHRNEEYNIITVLPDAKRHYMVLECEIDEPVTSY